MKIDFDYIWTDKKRTFLGLPWSFTRYILTENKLIVRSGFFNVHENELDLYRIIDKSLDMPFGQRMFGCGTVTLNVRDVDTPVCVIKSIKSPRKLMELIDAQIEAQRDKYNIRGRDMMNYDRPHPHDSGDHNGGEEQ